MMSGLGVVRGACEHFFPLFAIGWFGYWAPQIPINNYASLESWAKVCGALKVLDPFY